MSRHPANVRAQITGMQSQLMPHQRRYQEQQSHSCRGARSIRPAPTSAPLQGRLCKAMLGTLLSQLHWQPPPSMFSISTATALPSAAPRARVGLWFTDRFLQQACARVVSISWGSRGTGRGQQQQHRAASKPSPLPQGLIQSPSPAELPSSQPHCG